MKCHLMEQPSTSKVHETSAKIIFDDAKKAYDSLDEVLDSYRTRVNVVLAVATATAGLFAFEDTEKGALFYSALVTYAAAVLVSVLMYRPLKWKINISRGAVSVLKSDGEKLPPTKVYLDLAQAYQHAHTSNLYQINRRYGVAQKFTALLVLVAATVGLMLLNSANEPDKSPEKPTRVIIETE